jgi:haloacetate dehalogenase
VLLHGQPRTHRSFTVVCPDLRGYGQSSKPKADSAHQIYYDRPVADDIVRMMDSMGHRHFAVVGHDRGSYVAYRTALDHPERVTHLAVLDGVPVLEALDRVDAASAQAWWHWFFFASPTRIE